MPLTQDPFPHACVLGAGDQSYRQLWTDSCRTMKAIKNSACLQFLSMSRKTNQRTRESFHGRKCQVNAGSNWLMKTAIRCKLSQVHWVLTANTLIVSVISHRPALMTMCGHNHSLRTKTTHEKTFSSHITRSPPKPSDYMTIRSSVSKETSRGVEVATDCMNLEFRKENQARDGNRWVISVRMIFKARKLSIRGLREDRKD